MGRVWTLQAPGCPRAGAPVSCSHCIVSEASQVGVQHGQRLGGVKRYHVPQHWGGSRGSTRPAAEKWVWGPAVPATRAVHTTQRSKEPYRQTRGGHMATGTGPSGPRVRARGGQQQVAGEGFCLCRQQRQGGHSHGYYWGAFGGPEGRGPAKPGSGSRRSWRQTPLKGQGKVVPVVARPPACQPSCAQVLPTCPPTGSRRRPAEVCRHMRAGPQPPVASMLPYRPPC